MDSNRQWMYTRFRNGGLTREFLDGLDMFIDFATRQPAWMNGQKVRCPCNHRRCQNRQYLDVDTVKFHLSKYGFLPNYSVWIFQGEVSAMNDVQNEATSSLAGDEEHNAYHTMVRDAVGPDFEMGDVEEPPNLQAKFFYDMLAAVDKELWPGCQRHTQLSVVARLMSMKSEHHMSEKCFDQVTELMKEIVPADNLVVEDFYSSKKLLRGMGLPVEKIDCCLNNCMIYWETDKDLDSCKVCNQPRFKTTGRGAKKSFKRMYYFPLIPRLQRLYASNATASEMRWHAKFNR